MESEHDSLCNEIASIRSMSEARTFIEDIRERCGFIDWNSLVNVIINLFLDSKKTLCIQTQNVICEMFYNYRNEIPNYCLSKACDTISDCCDFKQSLWARFYIRQCRQYLSANGIATDDRKLSFLDGDLSKGVATRLLAKLNGKPQTAHSVGVPVSECETEDRLRLTQQDQHNALRDMETDLDLPADRPILELAGDVRGGVSAELINAELMDAGDGDAGAINMDEPRDVIVMGELSEQQESDLHQLYEALHGAEVAVPVAEFHMESSSIAHPAATQYLSVTDSSLLLAPDGNDDDDDDEESREPGADMLRDLLVALNTEQVSRHVLPCLHLPDLSETALVTFCRWLCDIDAQLISYATVTLLLRELLSHRFHLVSDAQSSRELTAAVTDVCRRFPKAFTESVLCRVFVSGGGGELSGGCAAFMCRLLGDAAYGYASLFLTLHGAERQDGGAVWQEPHVTVLHTAVDSCHRTVTDLPPATVHSLCAHINGNRERLTASLRFMKLVVTWCGKYGHQFTSDDVQLIRTAVSLNITFLKKKVIAILDGLSTT